MEEQKVEQPILSPPPSPPKIRSKKVIGILILVLISIIGGSAVAFLITRTPPTVELSYNFQPGESYTYDMTYMIEYGYLGSINFLSRDKMDVLERVNDEFNIRHSSTMQVIMLGEILQNVTSVMTVKMTNKGAMSGLEIEYVEPPELWASMEQTRGQWESYLQGVYGYPKDPVAVGQEWIIPLDMEYQESVISIRLTGEGRSSIVGRESITVGAGTFNCWHLVHKINASGETLMMGERVIMSMSGEGASWIDPQKCFQIKVYLPLSIKVEAAGQEITMQARITMELVE